MKLIRSQEEAHVFSMTQVEKEVLADLLRLYPLSPSDHYRISRFSSEGAETEADQALLDEAMEEQRQLHRDKIKTVFGSEVPHPCWSQTDDGQPLITLAQADIEWLLQVLNDIRVGSWYSLGCPENDSEDVDPAAFGESFHFRWAMDACSYFETILIGDND